MSTATKKISGLLFILLGFTPVLFLLFVAFQKKQIKHRMREELEHGVLVTVTVPENQVVWMDDHEIWVNNSMFDIQSKKLENGIYTFSGMYDEAETLLVEKERDVAGGSDEQNKLLARLFKSLPNFFHQQTHFADQVPEHDHHGSNIFDGPAKPFREILTPPPQLG